MPHFDIDRLERPEINANGNVVIIKLTQASGDVVEFTMSPNIAIELTKNLQASVAEVGRQNFTSPAMPYVFDGNGVEVTKAQGTQEISLSFPAPGAPFLFFI